MHAAKQKRDSARLWAARLIPWPSCACSVKGKGLGCHLFGLLPDARIGWSKETQQGNGAAWHLPSCVPMAHQEDANANGDNRTVWHLHSFPVINTQRTVKLGRGLKLN